MSVERAPDDARHVEEERLKQQDHRHPLVVGDHMALVGLVLARDVLLEWKVVGVAHPAVVVGVLFVVAGEVSRHPAADRLADVLLRADDDRERHQDGRRVAVMQPVREVVIVARLRLRHSADHSQDLIHDERRRRRRRRRLVVIGSSLV